MGVPPNPPTSTETHGDLGDTPWIVSKLHFSKKYIWPFGWEKWSFEVGIFSFVAGSGLGFNFYYVIAVVVVVVVVAVLVVVVVVVVVVVAVVIVVIMIVVVISIILNVMLILALLLFSLWTTMYTCTYTHKGKDTDRYAGISHHISPHNHNLLNSFERFTRSASGGPVEAWALIQPFQPFLQIWVSTF